MVCLPFVVLVLFPMKYSACLRSALNSVTACDCANIDIVALVRAAEEGARATGLVTPDITACSLDASGIEQGSGQGDGDL